MKVGLWQGGRSKVKRMQVGTPGRRRTIGSFVDHIIGAAIDVRKEE